MKYKIVDFAIGSNGVAMLAENENEWIMGVVYDLEDTEEVSLYDICGKRHMNKNSWTLFEVKEKFCEHVEIVKNSRGMIWG